MKTDEQDVTCTPGWVIAKIIELEMPRLTRVARELATDQYEGTVSGLSLLVQRTGLSRTTYRNILNGQQHDVLLDTVDRIINFGCELDWHLVIDQDRYLIPMPGRRCAEEMALAERPHLLRTDPSIQRRADELEARRRAAHKEPHDDPFADP